MNDNIRQTGTFNFSIDSSLLFQLGEQLVAKPSIALAELVKNSYDADATRVRVTMEHVGQKGGTLCIEDNGHGMTFEEVKDYWMRIATNSKRGRTVSRRYCRPLTGAKGIGRFAARRLGEKLIIQSVAETDHGTTEAVVAEFDWAQNFLDGQDLTEIPVTYTREQVAADSQTGVSLYIEKARDAWTPEEISDLRRDLLSLQSPFPDLIVKEPHEKDEKCLDDPGFNFELEIAGADDLERFTGGLGESFLNLARVELSGWIDNEGIAHYEIEIRDTGEKDTLVDNSQDSERLDKIKLAGLRIFYFIYETSFFQEADFSVRDAARKGREEGGIRVYLDGFRIFPYGTEGDDWLKLDWYVGRNVDMATEIGVSEQVRSLAMRSSFDRPWLNLPRNRQLFGAVSVSQSLHPHLEIKASREGFVENEAFEQLRLFVQRGIYWLTIRYAAAAVRRRAERRQKREQTVPEIIDEAKSSLEKISRQTKSEINESYIAEDQRETIFQEVLNISVTLDRASQQAEQEAQEHITEIAMLRLLASAGTTLLLMDHQLQAVIGAVSQIEQDLRRFRSRIPDTLYEVYDDIIDQVAEWKVMVERQVSQLGFLLSPEKRERRRRHALHQIVENVRKPMSFYMNNYNVEFENKVPRNLRTPAMYEAELYAVLINILSNALKAVYERAHRKIAVEAEKGDSRLILRMLDTGVGVPPERRAMSFEPFITSSMPNPVLGVGTGMGLAVVRDIIEFYNGTVRFIDAELPWQTCIEITLPY